VHPQLLRDCPQHLERVGEIVVLAVMVELSCKLVPLQSMSLAFLRDVPASGPKTPSLLRRGEATLRSKRLRKTRRHTERPKHHTSICTRTLDPTQRNAP
jgi:hypothetical protein